MSRRNGKISAPVVVSDGNELCFVSPRERWLLLKIRELAPHGRGGVLLIDVDEQGVIRVSSATPKGKR